MTKGNLLMFHNLDGARPPLAYSNKITGRIWLQN